ncbi:pre-mRNA-splicing factor SYF2, partial [Phenoliferia sp. Uapishka_3]
MPPRRKQQPLVKERSPPVEEPVADEQDDEASEAVAADDDDEVVQDPLAVRAAKMAALRKRMSESAQANRKDLIAETSTTRANARNAIKLERKRKQAEAMGEKAEARDTGEDLERKRAWEYSIEDNEKWDKKVARKGRRADFTFTDYDDIARRKYKKVVFIPFHHVLHPLTSTPLQDLDVFKPDLTSYNAQRALADGASSALVGTSAALAAAEDLYRDANSFVYADHKPSEDAIDRVIGKINLDLDKRQKRSRERKNEDEGDITYINEKNKHFNKKLERYYNNHTKDIRDNFERGTAL